MKSCQTWKTKRTLIVNLISLCMLWNISGNTKILKRKEVF